MTQPTQRSNLLGRATPYENPRYKADREALEAHDKAQTEEKANPEVTEDKVEPSHNWEKRYKDLQSYNSRKINELTNKIKDLENQGVKPVFVPKTQEELDALREQDPEGYARIEAIASTIAGQQLQQYDQKLANINGDLQATKIEKAQLEIRKAHPDYDAIVNDDAFHNWAEDQDQMIQDWIYNNPDEPAKAIKALSLFKFESGWGKDTKDSPQVPQGGDVDVGIRTTTQSPEHVDRNHPAYIWKESEIARMRPEEFGKWSEVITLAQREGRVAIGQ